MTRWRHPGNCTCRPCRLNRQEERIRGAHANGWTAERIAKAGGLPLAFVRRVLAGARAA